MYILISQYLEFSLEFTYRAQKKNPQLKTINRNKVCERKNVQHLHLFALTIFFVGVLTTFLM